MGRNSGSQRATAAVSAAISEAGQQTENRGPLLRATNRLSILVKGPIDVLYTQPAEKEEVGGATVPPLAQDTTHASAQPRKREVASGRALQTAR